MSVRSRIPVINVGNSRTVLILVRSIGRVITPAVLALLSSLLSAVAIAAEYKPAATQNYLVQPAPAVTLETATAIIRHKTGGRVLSANPASKGADVGYQVRVLVDERLVQTWFVDEKGRAESE